MSPKSHSTDSRTVLMEELKACMAGVRTAFLKGAWPDGCAEGRQGHRKGTWLDQLEKMHAAADH